MFVKVNYNTLQCCHLTNKLWAIIPHLCSCLHMFVTSVYKILTLDVVKLVWSCTPPSPFSCWLFLFIILWTGSRSRSRCWWLHLHPTRSNVRALLQVSCRTGRQRGDESEQSCVVQYKHSKTKRQSASIFLLSYRQRQYGERRLQNGCFHKLCHLTEMRRKYFHTTEVPKQNNLCNHSVVQQTVLSSEFRSQWLVCNLRDGTSNFSNITWWDGNFKTFVCTFKHKNNSRGTFSGKILQISTKLLANTEQTSTVLRSCCFRSAGFSPVLSGE